MLKYSKKKKKLGIPCGLGNSICQEDSSIRYQEKQVDSSTIAQVVTYDSGYNALSQVVINPYVLEQDSSTLTDNGSYVFYPIHSDALSAVFVDVSIAKSVEQEKNLSVTENGTYTLTPDPGYTGISKAILDVSVESGITPEGNFTLNDLETHDVSTYATANVNPVGIIPGNIRKDVEILGVTGTFEGGELTEETVDSSTVSQTVTPSEGYYGLSSVTVNPYTLESKSDSITENGSYTYTAESADGLDSVTVDVSVDTVNNQSKTVNSSTSSQEITYDSGYTGLEKVTINPYTLESKSDSVTANGTYTYTPQSANGLDSVTVDVSVDTVNNQSKIVNSSTSYQTVTPDAGYTGLDSVTINPYNLDHKTVNSSTNVQTVTSSVDGLSQVTVNPYTVESKSDSITENGSYTYTPDEANALSSVSIDVNVPGEEINNQTKTVDSSSVSQIVTYDSGYTGIESVTVNPYDLETLTPGTATEEEIFIGETAWVDGEQLTGEFDYPLVNSDIDDILGQSVIQYQAKTADASTESQVISADAGYLGLSQVTVNPYSLESKSDSVTENGTYTYTPDDAEGLGSVTVTVNVPGEEIINQTKTVNSSTSSQEITYDSGYTGLEKVTVNPYTVESKSDSITVNGSYTYTPDNANALSSVTVSVNVPGEEINNQSKTVDSSSVSQIVTYDAGYTGLESVTVNPYDLETLTPGTATEEEIFLGKTAWVDGEQLTGEFDYDLVDGDIDDLLGDSELLYQVKTADSSTVSQTVRPDAGYLGLTQVTVNPIIAEDVTCDPSTHEQTVTASTAGNLLNSVTVSAVDNTIDVNITAGNIKKDVTILGVTGTLEGGEYDFSWIRRAQRQELTDLSGYTLPSGLAAIRYGMENMFNSLPITKAPDLSNVTLVEHYGMRYMFRYCRSLTTPPDLSGVTSVGASGMEDMFDDCTNLQTAPDLSNVTFVDNRGMYEMFDGCYALSGSIDLSGVTSVGKYGMQYMFYDCSNIRSVDLSGVTSVGNYGMNLMFDNCMQLREISVGWTTWPTASSALTGWVKNVAASGTFHCPPGLEEIFDNDHIPAGWTVVHDVV